MRTKIRNPSGFKEVYVSQVKQKFGLLRIYVDGPDSPYRREVEAIAEVVEKESASVCEYCGAPGELTVVDRWSLTACPTHLKEIQAGNRNPEVAPHSWIVETIDGGPVGEGDFLYCPTCFASGGSVLFPDKKPFQQPFLAGWGSGRGSLSRDCVEAKRQVQEILASKEWAKYQDGYWKSQRKGILDEIQTSYHIALKAGKKNVIYGPTLDGAGRAFEVIPKLIEARAGWTIKFGKDGEHQDYAQYGDVLDRIHAYYGGLILEPLRQEFEPLLAPLGFTMEISRGRIFCSINSKDDKGWTIHNKSFVIGKRTIYYARLDFRRGFTEDMKHYESPDLQAVKDFVMRFVA